MTSASTFACECSSCHRQEEVWAPSGKPKDFLCLDCRGEAPQLMVKGNAPPIKLDWSDLPIGWERGNTGRKQEARYDEIVETTRRRAKAVDKDAIKGGIRHIARVPRELHRLRTKQFGKDYWDPSAQSTADIKAKLKADRLYFHKD